MIDSTELFDAPDWVRRALYTHHVYRVCRVCREWFPIRVLGTTKEDRDVRGSLTTCRPCWSRLLNHSVLNQSGDVE